MATFAPARRLLLQNQSLEDLRRGKFSLGLPGFQRMEAMARHRTHSADFKRQVAQEFLAGETLHGLAKRHDVSRNLIRIWVAKYEAGAFDDDARAADLLQEYEAKIAALELEF